MTEEQHINEVLADLRIKIKTAINKEKTSCKRWLTAGRHYLKNYYKTDNHYTYRIEHNTGVGYIGSRTTQLQPQDDLGKTYWSSSSDKAFIDDQKKNPGDYRYQVIGTHPSRKSAINEEIALHAFFDVATNPMYFNKSNQTSEAFDTTGTRIMHNNVTEEITNGTKLPVGWEWGYPKSHKKNQGKNNPMYGVARSQSSKDKQHDAMTGYKTYNDGAVTVMSKTVLDMDTGRAPTDKKFFTNGVIDRKYTPGSELAGWVLGRIQQPTLGKVWYNNGTDNAYVYPGEEPDGYKEGMINNNNTGSTGMHWYTDGDDSVVCFEKDKPDGYRRGRTLKDKNGL